MERCQDCKHWKRDVVGRYEDFGMCWCEKFASYEDVLYNTDPKDKHIICGDPLITTNKDFGCIDFEGKAWSLK